MKRYAAAIALTLLMAALLWRGDVAAAAVRDGLALCARSVIPSLFPFFVAVSLFTALGLAESCGRVLAPVMRLLLGCSGTGAVAFALGAVGGYPVGGRTVGELYAAGAVDRAEAERLLAFCNNCGPAFVLGIVGTGCFGSTRVGWWLYAIHITAAILTAQWHRRGGSSAIRTIHRSRLPLSTALVRAVTGGAQAMLSVCAFVVFFQVALRLLTAETGLSHPLLVGAIELTGGVMQLSATRAGFVMAAALLGWGGCSVHCQTAAALGDTGLSMGQYLAGKAAQAVLSAALAALVSRWCVA